MTARIRRGLRLLRLYVKLQLLHIRVHLEYRVDFLIGVVAVVLMHGSGFVFVWALFERVPEVGGWTFWEIALLYALAILPRGLVELLADGPWFLRQQLNTGEFDRMLVRPVPPALQVLALRSSLHGLGSVLLGGFILLQAARALDPGWHAGHLLFLAATVAGGVVMITSINLGSQCAFFWEPASTGSFPFLVGNLTELVKFPLSLYGRVIQIALTWLLPFAFLSYYPALILLDKPGDWSRLGYISPLVGPLLALAVSQLWRLGVARYQGTGH